MDGLMMDYQLTLPTLLRRVETYFGDKQVITRLPDKSFHRYTYRDMTRRAKQLTVDYKIDGTPAMGVNGHYTVSAGDGLFPTVDSLIERERKKK